MSPLEPTFNSSPSDVPAPGLDRSPSQKRATVRFWIGLIAGLCLVVLLALILLPAFARINVHRGRPNTQNHMKVMGLVFKMYANESAGNLWPNLAPHDRIWAPDLSVIYPEFLQDPSVLVASEHPDAEHIRGTLRAVLEGPNPDYETAAGLMALSFAYLPFAVTNEAEFKSLTEARRQGLLDSTEQVLELPEGKGKLARLHEFVRPEFAPSIPGPDDPPELSPLTPFLVEVWEWKRLRHTGEFTGANVLYICGEVKRVPLGTFPVVPSVMDGLCGLTP